MPIRAELRKIRTARPLLAVPVLSVAYAVLSFGPALTLPAAERRAMGPDTLLAVARGPGFVLAVAMLVLGVLAAAGEFRHGTVVATLLVTPRRRTALAAKAAAVAVTAALTALAVEAVAVGLGVLFLRANDVAIGVSAGDVLLTAAGTVAAAVLYGLAGVGLGSALRDQTAAVGAVLLWVGVVEGAVPVVLRTPWLFRWLPGGAVNALLGAADPPPDLLPAWSAALILLGVVAALVATGAAVLTRRDVPA